MPGMPAHFESKIDENEKQKTIQEVGKMTFTYVENEKSAKIKVIGVGGAGGNAVNNMIDSKLQGVKFIAANTDAQSLEVSKAPVKLQIGSQLTEGLGAGADPQIGREAAIEDVESIKNALSDSHMVFITAGFGGGDRYRRCTDNCRGLQGYRRLNRCRRIEAFLLRREKKSPAGPGGNRAVKGICGYGDYHPE